MATTPLKITKNSIKAYFEEANITNYTIHSDLSVTFSGNAVFHSGTCKKLKMDIVSNLGILPFKIANAKGDLVFGRMFLISLLNFPKEVGGKLDISSNKLKSLVHCPTKIGTMFVCSGNKELLNLDYGPIEVGGDYEATDCNLMNCQNLPKVIPGSLVLSNNKLKSIPEDLKISGACCLSSNTFIDYPKLIHVDESMVIVENNPCTHADEYERETW